MKKQKKAIALLLVLTLFAACGVLPSFGAVTKLPGDNLYSVTIDFEGGKESFFDDRNICWDNAEAISFAGGKMQVGKEGAAGIASIRPVGETEVWADVCVTQTGDGDLSGAAFGVGLPNVFVNLQDPSGLWFLLAEGGVVVKAGQSQVTVSASVSLSEETTYTVQITGQEARLFGGAAKQLLCRAARENGALTVYDGADNAIGTLSGTWAEMGYVKAASYHAQTTIDNFGYQFEGDEYLQPRSEEELKTIKQQADLLAAFDITQEGGVLVDLTQEGNLSRAEAAFLAAGLVGAPRAQAASAFSDVSADNAYAGAISALVLRNAVSGMGGGLFRPDDAITYRDLMSMTVNALGYKQMAASRGGYPNGYFFVARYVGMTKGISLKGTDAVSKADAARIFANALLSDYYESTYLSGDAVNFVCTGTVLEVLHNAGKVTGVALEAGNCSLTTDFAAAKDEINISGAMFKTGGKDCRDYVGTSVTAYFDLEDKNEIKFLCDSGKNNIVTLNAKNLVSATLEKITYEAGGAEKSYRINGAEVMRNGSKKPYPEDGDLLPAAGTVTLVDNDNDNKFEVVKVMSYQTMLVGSANSADNSVTDKYTGQKVVIGDEETTDITYENGAGVEMTFADIAPGMVLLYAVDEGGKNVRVLLCDDKVSGSVNKISKDGITVGSAVYSFSAFYENAKKSGASWVVEPVVGQSYTLYLSPFGEIAFLEKGTTSAGSIYGILMRAGSEDKVLETEIVFLEVFNHLGEKKIYQLAEKVKLNGKTGVKAKDVLPQVAGFKDKVLKMKTNGDGAISELETPVLRDNLDYSMLGKEFNMIDLSQKLGAIRYKPTSLSFNFRLGITAQTIVFNTTYRDDGTLDEKLTTVMQGSGFELEQEMQPAANSRDNVICYGISRDGIVSVVTKGPNSKNNINPTFLLVTGISQALDAGGNVATAVEGIANAQKVTYTIDEDDTTTLEQLSVGCIACVLVNSENEIEIRESDNGRGNLVWDKNKITGDGLDFYGVKSSSGDVMYSWVLMGRVFEYKNDVLMVTTAKTIDKMTVENTYYIKLSGPMRTYSYDDGRENPFTESTAKSIRGSSDSALDGSKVLLNIVDYNLADIVIVD